MAVWIETVRAELNDWKPCAPEPRSASEKSLRSASWIWCSPGHVEIALGGLRDHSGADIDQLATQRQVVDEAGVVDDLRAEGGGIQQVGEVAGAADLGQLAVALEVFAQGDAVGDAAVGDLAVQHFEDGLVGGRVKIAWFQDVGDALVGVVVEQDRAQHGHFGLQVVRQHGGGRGVLVVLRHGPSLGQRQLRIAT